MGWFGKQLYDREAADNAVMEEAIDSIVNAAMGRRLADALSNAQVADSAMDVVLKFYHIKPSKEHIPDNITETEARIEYIIRPHGIKTRKVVLDGGWWHSAVGVMVGTLKEDGSAIVLLPGKIYGYDLVNLKTGKKLKVNRKTEKLIDSEAFCFYEPLPLKPLKTRDLLVFLTRQANISEIMYYLLFVACSAAIGLLAPVFTKLLFSTVLDSESLRVLLAIAVFMFCYTLSGKMLSVFKLLIGSRIQIKLDAAVHAAIMNRLFSLPPSFFREYSTGELAKRTKETVIFCSTLFNFVETAGLAFVFCLVYIIQIFSFAPALVLPAAIVFAVTIAATITAITVKTRILSRVAAISAKTTGLSYATISGIQKIKLAGAEKRMFARWAETYSKEIETEYNVPVLLKFYETICLAFTLIGNIVIYAIAVKNNIAVSDYLAFNTAYSIAAGTLTSFISSVDSIATLKPSLEMAKPILEAAPEFQEKKEDIGELDGSIEFSHVSFGYSQSMPDVIDDFSLKINPGEYLAITGNTGCGKSTLLRLIMGFEAPQKGNIFINGKDIFRVDLDSVRKKMGVVMQNGKLFPGDILSNIMITVPELGIERAWEAAKIASIDEDIRKMPMGMFTFISEGMGGISGGQKQRLLIARAIAPSPKILMFDEATSALDNDTQKKVSEAIDALNCTRIVIAHRLSTVKNADRIIYIEGGRIMEEGTYDELIGLNGRFAKLVERQRLDIELK